MFIFHLEAGTALVPLIIQYLLQLDLLFDLELDQDAFHQREHSRDVLVHGQVEPSASTAHNEDLVGLESHPAITELRTWDVLPVQTCVRHLSHLRKETIVTRYLLLVEILYLRLLHIQFKSITPSIIRDRRASYFPYFMLQLLPFIVPIIFSCAPGLYAINPGR